MLFGIDEFSSLCAIFKSGNSRRDSSNNHPKRGSVKNLNMSKIRKEVENKILYPIKNK